MAKKYLFNDDINEYITQNKNYFDNLSLNDNDIVTEASAQLFDDLDILKSAVSYFDNVLKDKNERVLVVACLGLWYGKKYAKKVFRDLYHALFLSNIFEDTNALYFERKNTTLTLSATHHDGTNIFKFYLLKNGKKHAITYNLLSEAF